MYIKENDKEARVERKLYESFSKWVQARYICGKPTTAEWTDIMGGEEVLATNSDDDSNASCIPPTPPFGRSLFPSSPSSPFFMNRED